MRRKSLFITAVFASSLTVPAEGAVTLYTTQGSFQSALTGSFTLVNLDAAPLNAFASGYRVDDAGPAAAFATLGIDFVSFNPRVLANQNGQTPTDRDRLIENGATNGGLITINLLTPAHGIGGLSNLANAGDGGFIRAFSGPNLGGTLLGSVAFGRNAQLAGAQNGFGGLISTDLIGSVQFTCDHDGDLRCGVYDIQHGTVAAGNVVPEPGAWALMILGFGLIGWQLRRQRGATMAVTA